MPSTAEKLKESISQLLEYDQLQDAVDLKPDCKPYLLEDLEADVLSSVIDSVPEEKV